MAFNDNGDIHDTDADLWALFRKLEEACVGYEFETIMGATAGLVAVMVLDAALPGRDKECAEEFIAILRERVEAGIERKAKIKPRYATGGVVTSLPTRALRPVYPAEAIDRLAGGAVVVEVGGSNA